MTKYDFVVYNTHYPVYGKVFFLLLDCIVLFGVNFIYKCFLEGYNKALLQGLSNIPYNNKIPRASRSHIVFNERFIYY